MLASGSVIRGCRLFCSATEPYCRTFRDGPADVQNLAGHPIPTQMLFGVCAEPRSVARPHCFVAQDLLDPVGKFQPIVAVDSDAQIADVARHAGQPRGEDRQPVGRSHADRQAGAAARHYPSLAP